MVFSRADAIKASFLRLTYLQKSGEAGTIAVSPERPSHTLRGQSCLSGDRTGDQQFGADGSKSRNKPQLPP